MPDESMLLIRRVHADALNIVATKPRCWTCRDARAGRRGAGTGRLAAGGLAPAPAGQAWGR